MSARSGDFGMRCARSVLLPLGVVCASLVTAESAVTVAQDWAARLAQGGVSNRYGAMVAVDDAGYIYVAGSYPRSSVITAKYDQLGNQIWQREFDNPGTREHGSWVAVHPSGGVVVAGYTVCCDYSDSNTTGYVTLRYDGSTGKKIKRLPYRVYVSAAVLALWLAGLALSSYLAVSHYRVHTDPGYHSFCALSKAINCDTVSSSPYSILWGLPVAVWGMAAYAFMLILVGFAGHTPQEGRRCWATMLLAALVSSLSSLIFAGISAFKIGSYCILCIATYAISFFLVYMVWIIRRRYRAQPFLSSLSADLRLLWSKRNLSIPVMTAFGVGLLMTRLFFPAYWDAQQPAASIHVSERDPEFCPLIHYGVFRFHHDRGCASPDFCR